MPVEYYLNIKTLLNQLLFGNSIQSYVYATALTVCIWMLSSLFMKVIVFQLRQLSRSTQSKIDDTFTAMVKSIPSVFWILSGVYLSSTFLVIPEFWSEAIWGMFFIVFIFSLVRAFQIFITFIFEEKLLKSSLSGSQEAIHGLMTVVKYGIWILAGLLIASNLGFNITSLLAGLGVGGVAVAFALQNILEDLFSSFALYFDRPFSAGDFVVVGNQSGTVERIGIKTTRLRALQGEEIVISNRDLTTAQVQNFKRLEERRVVIRFGVPYETKKSHRELIPELVRTQVSKLEGVRFGRIHLDELGDSGLIFELVYFIEDPSYDFHMDCKQKLFFALLEEFEKKKITFSYPTQTIWIQR